jgi:hypothetical protein
MEQKTGNMLEQKGKFDKFTILEAPDGFILSTVGRTLVIDQGDVKDITKLQSAYTDGAASCTAFLAIANNGRLYLGHTDGHDYTEEQRQVLQNSRSVIAGSGEVNASETIKSQFPNITKVYEIPKPIRIPEGQRALVNLLVNPKNREIVYDWGFVTDD